MTDDGRLCHDDGGHEGGDRRRRPFMLVTLIADLERQRQDVHAQAARISELERQQQALQAQAAQVADLLARLGRFEASSR